MRENNLLDFNMYEQSLTQNVKQPNGAYSKQATPPPNLTTKDITENGEYSAAEDNADGYSSVTVDVSGGGGLSGTDVKFYDYDGTVVYSYSAEDFLALTELPANPTHEGFNAQGWNWTLADMKAHVTTFGNCAAGQMYTTSDGKTKYYIRMSEYDIEDSVGLIISSTDTSSIEVDWGDGSDPQTYTSSDYVSGVSHTYAAAGAYTITLEVTSGIITVGGEYTIYPNSSILHGLVIGDNVDVLTIYSCSNLNYISIPYGVTKASFTGGNNCLPFVILPNSITQIWDDDFQQYVGLHTVVTPNSLTQIGSYSGAFSECKALSNLVIPDRVTALNCTLAGTMSSIDIPNSVTSIDLNCFSSCYALTNINIDNTEGAISGAPWGNYGYVIVNWLRDE